MGTFSLGSLYFGEKLVDIGSEWNGKTISIGNTIPNHAITWVKRGNLLIATDIVCTKINWESLNQESFIFGRNIVIDGKPYQCRSVKGGERRGDSNEWDSILNSLSDDDAKILSTKASFFAQDHPEKNSCYCTVRGGHSEILRWSKCGIQYADHTIGFRPVLEPLMPELSISDDLIGSKINIYGPDELPITGRLMEYTEYDLFVEASNVTKNKWYCVLQNGVAIIDRSSISYLTKA